MNALLDKDFLRELDNYKHREIYARITALTVDELPIEMIEGKVSGGNISIDGASAVRRTCSLSLIAEDIDINGFYWGLNNKIKIEIGLKNFINPKYNDIIWFPQGVYVITSFNTSLSPNGYNISINGKDKMCLLNGDVGGSLPASIDFGVEEVYEDDMVIYNKLSIRTIIKELLHTYALEPYFNIIINDLDDKGLELLEYRGSTPLYLSYNIDYEEYQRMDFDGSTECFLSSNGEPITLETIPKYNKRVDELLYDEATKDELLYDKATKIKFEKDGNNYLVSKVEFGQTAGYRLTELTYAGDLISNIGESITSILDKIVKMLGNFEYFYDLNGRFIFQEKKTYINTSWSPIIKTDEEMYVENAAYIDSNTYYFDGNNLIKSFSNNPNLNNVKNDYSIWGIRKGIGGAEIPIHFRYAIHKKPVYYKNFKGEEFTSQNYDWRELIYQMSLDYLKHNQEDDFYTNISKNNFDYYPTGRTGYEQFYVDLQGFWRDLYNPSNDGSPWDKKIEENPDLLNFWIDFLDASEENGFSELDKFAINALGNRPKVVNDTNVKSIYYRNVPNLIFTTNIFENIEDFKEKTGYVFMQIDDESSMSYFSISAQGKSAKDALDELLYNHSYCSESINISALPVYYLEPNTRISVRDELSKINGEYIISRISIPLTYNGQMTIQATKAPQRFN